MSAIAGVGTFGIWVLYLGKKSLFPPKLITVWRVLKHLPPKMVKFAAQIDGEQRL